MMERVTIVGTGLIGASIGLALKQAGFAGIVTGVDTNAAELSAALFAHAIDRVASSKLELRQATEQADAIVLAVPVLAVLDWMQRLAPALGPHQLVTDAGSTKLQISEMAREHFNHEGTARFLPGHPMAGKEQGGAALAEAELFRGATWLFTPIDHAEQALEAEWRAWVAKFGAKALDMDAARHDEICAWVSHLPQMLSTALAALLEERFAGDPARRDEIAAIGGRALREMTRLGASPYSMWRDIAQTNSEPIAVTLHALEQRLAHLRENLRTPELKEEFRLANEFRTSKIRSGKR
jgi:prephenate dehydrogenase